MVKFFLSSNEAWQRTSKEEEELTPLEVEKGDLLIKYTQQE
ncbi:hypothetical protein V7247_25560 [Priestia megaterium]